MSVTRERFSSSMHLRNRHRRTKAQTDRQTEQHTQTHKTTKIRTCNCTHHQAASRFECPDRRSCIAAATLANAELRLHRGSIGKTLEGVSKKTGQKVAIKALPRSHPEFDYKTLMTEIAIMKRVDHPHCIKLHDVFEDDKLVYLVQDL